MFVCVMMVMPMTVSVDMGVYCHEYLSSSPGVARKVWPESLDAETS
jgi:hypothetical protein